MEIVLSNEETRVLGSLVEKEITTPDYYPLSLNALLNACNQKSNRDPVMSLDEDDVRRALDDLNRKGLAGAASSADSRVPKFEHRLQEVFNFDRRETAVLSVLLLRGPQTPGELRGRTERMYPFNDLDEVLSTLHRLIERDPPLVKMLPRHPGTKESRYAHLLSGEVEAWEAPPAPGSAAEREAPSGDRLEHLESEVANLRTEVAELKQQFADFRKQFDVTAGEVSSR
ncbi:MAG TPA: YceH family protein [Terriglobia bacterium]